MKAADLSQVTALIQAGGLGNRIRELYPNIPKPLIPIAGRPVLFRQIDWLIEAGLTNFIVLCCYKADQIQQALAEEFPAQKIEVFVEKTPLGTGGCLSLVKGKVKGSALVISADVLFDFPVLHLIGQHREASNRITISLYATPKPFDGDLVAIDQYGNVKNLLIRPHPSSLIFENRVNAAATVVESCVIDDIPSQTVLNFEKDILLPFLNRGNQIGTYTPQGFIKDIGTPDGLEAANRYWSRKISVDDTSSESIFLTSWPEILDDDRRRDWDEWYRQNFDSISKLKDRAREGLQTVVGVPMNKGLNGDRSAELDTYLCRFNVKVDRYRVNRSIDREENKS